MATPFLFRASLGLSCLLVYPNAMAMNDSVDIFELNLSQLMQITVTGATLTPLTINTAPSAVTVFRQQDIAHFGVTYLYELLNFVPGFQSQRIADSATSYGYGVRGRRNGSLAKEVLLVLDGQVLNDPRTGAANTGVRLLKLSNIERIEVIRGPGSALYGSGAYAGVINMVSQQHVNQVTVRGGEFGAKELGVSKTLSINDVSGHFNANVYEDDGQLFNVDDNFNSDPSVRIDTRDAYRVLDVNTALHFGGFKLGFIGQTTRADDFYSLETIANGFNNYRSQYYHGYGEYRFTWLTNISSQISVSSKWVENAFDTQASAAGAFFTISNPPSNDPLLLQALVQGRTHRLAWSNDMPLSTTASMQFGLELIENTEITSQANDNFNTDQLANGQYPIDYFGDLSHTTRSDTQDPQRNIGLYVQSLYQVSDTQQFNFGLRFDSNKQETLHTSPRIGWVHQLSDQHTYKVLYGEAFRASSLNESSAPDSFILKGNLNLKHETIRTLDLIYQYQQGDLAVQAGWYANQYNDPIVTAFTNTGGREFVNGASSDIQGIELEMNYAFSEKLSVRMTHSQLIDKPEIFFREADRQSSLALHWQHDQWWLDASGIVVGSRKTPQADQLVPLSGYELLYGQLGYQMHAQHEVSLNIANLLDVQFETPVQGNRLTEGTPNRGRMVSVKYVWSF